jgi:hypothetical protein
MLYLRSTKEESVKFCGQAVLVIQKMLKALFQNIVVTPKRLGAKEGPPQSGE